VVILWTRRNSLGLDDEQDLSGVGRGPGVAAAGLGTRLRPGGPSGAPGAELVRAELDLSPIVAADTEERGQPPYHPAMMVALLRYASTQGIYASRKIAKACEERLDVMAVTGMQRPDFRTINDFRKQHLEALAGLFTQVLRLCHQAGLIKLGHVALDGTKLAANASKHKAMSYGRMQRAEAALAAEVAGWLARAEREDAADEAAHGPEKRGDELPDWVADKQERLARIRAAKTALEAEAQAEPPPADAEPGPSSGMIDRGRRRCAPDGGPPTRAQRTLTDPDSRVLKTRDGFVQGYNGQLAVDGAHQIITACRLTTNGSDQDGLVPLLDATTAALRRKPREVSADAGFCRESNLAALDARGIRGYLAPGRAAHGAADLGGRRRIKPGSRMAAMAAKLRRAGRRSRYRLRKQTVEPVIGQIKHARGFRHFLLRGFIKVKDEWVLVCTAHNLTKLLAARTA
jgi:transposase